MADYRVCKQCGRTYQAGSSHWQSKGFCQYFCLENYEREHKLSSNSSNNKNELVEGAFTVIGAGLSLLAGSGKSEAAEKPTVKKVSNADRLAELTALRESLEKKNEEWERNNPELAKKIKEEDQKREQMRNWSLEQWYIEIDDMFDKCVEEIKGNTEKAYYNKNDTKIIGKLEKIRDKQKEIIRLNFDKLTNGYNSKARIKIFNAFIDFKGKCRDLKYKSSVLSREKNPIGATAFNVGYFLEVNKKIINAAICISATVIFFLLIFIFKSIGLVWGSVITVAIMAEAFAITSKSDNIGNKIAQILFIPILGGIGGLVVGGIAWIFSSFSTFTMILWSIVMLGASAILIFYDDM